MVPRFAIHECYNPVTFVRCGGHTRCDMITALRKLGFVACILVSASVASAQSFRVTLLGTGSPIPVMDRFGPSILVEAGSEKLLFDCGRGCAQRLFQLQIPFAKLTVLFVTHLHSDHIVGIPDFWLTGWVYGRQEPLHIWGPAGTGEMVSNLEKAYRFDIHIRRDVDEKLSATGVQLVSADISEGVVYERNGVKVTVFNVDHGPVKPAFGYRVDYGGHSVVLSGDTRVSENLIRNAKDTDLLIHEVMDVETFRKIRPELTERQIQAVKDHHTSPEDAGTVFARVKPKLAVYSHIAGGGKAEDVIAATRKTYSGPLEFGTDLMSFDVGDKIEVHRHPPAE